MSVNWMPPGIPRDLCHWPKVPGETQIGLTPGELRQRYARGTRGYELHYQGGRLIEIIAYDDGMLIDHWQLDPLDGSGGWAYLTHNAEEAL